MLERKHEAIGADAGSVAPTLEARSTRTWATCFDENHIRSESGTHEIALPPYGHHWYRVGAPDNALNRTSF